MYPRVILKETLYKKSQQKRRTSPCNYKERIFVFNTQDLTYFEHRPGKRPTQKGCIELSHIKCVEIVCSDAPIPCDYKYPFQIAHDSYYLYVFAPDNDCRLKWVRALKEATQCNNLFVKYHPNFWGEGKWRCCHQTDKLATGCSEYYPNGAKPLPPTPDPKHRFLDLEERIVVALRNFNPEEDTDLPLHKDEEYIVIDSSEPNWWTVRDKNGNVGPVPCIYIAEKFSNDIEKFEWYNKDMTRTEAEELLMRENKDGGFMVRDSRHAGVYTVSIFTRASCTYKSDGEKCPVVKHYQIKETEGENIKYYLAEKYVFSSIPELIRYHQHNSAGLVTRLRHCVSRHAQNSSRIKELSSEKWEIHPDELILSEELGSGQFGLVWKGYWHEQQVAVKTVREGFMSEEEFKEEAHIMMKLSHTKLVQLYGVVTQRSPMYLVFEFMENGCLTDFLRDKKGSLSQEVLQGMCLDVSEGMAYLESSNFIHRDLAARNCLVSNDHVVKISDFGMTRFVLDDQYTSSYGTKFPVKWSSPEVIRFGKYSSKSDVWSFGVFMWEVYSEGRVPYDNRSNSEVVEALNAGLRLLLRPRLCPQSVYDLMQWSWKEKPEDRPSFALLLHELACLDQDP
ncbi:tyrosine-protein kinase ITK/TSK-like [Xyrauchen texanus]|uniref:tyrosine-protein kinase ITK/TSK-like n=1 Tax=Xyrauchen texanus TaxID=154827 RepID=UPI002242A0AF|nr:tyrosine-protein kinase ITK/TSK-like [Xyrauchen texanus]